MGHHNSHQMSEAFETRAIAVAPAPSITESADAEVSHLAMIAEREYANRRRRDASFAPGTFAEPAWDMLLDLYVQQHQKRSVSIHSLCIAAAVPPTTALRWIGRLVEAGLMKREPSLQDNRVVYVALTDEGRSAMEKYLRGRL